MTAAARRSARVATHPLTFILRTVLAFRANQGVLLAGAIACYTPLSILPLLILMLIALSQAADQGVLSAAPEHYRIDAPRFVIAAGDRHRGHRLSRSRLVAGEIECAVLSAGRHGRGPRAHVDLSDHARVAATLVERDDRRNYGDRALVDYSPRRGPVLRDHVAGPHGLHFTVGGGRDASPGPPKVLGPVRFTRQALTTRYAKPRDARFQGRCASTPKFTRVQIPVNSRPAIRTPSRAFRLINVRLVAPAISSMACTR